MKNGIFSPSDGFDENIGWLTIERRWFFIKRVSPLREIENDSSFLVFLRDRSIAR